MKKPKKSSSLFHPVPSYLPTRPSIYLSNSILPPLFIIFPTSKILYRPVSLLVHLFIANDQSRPVSYHTISLD